MHESKAFKMAPWPASHHNKSYTLFFLFLRVALLQIINVKIHIQEQAFTSANFLYQEVLPWVSATRTIIFLPST